jgi:hypothetical protein
MIEVTPISKLSDAEVIASIRLLAGPAYMSRGRGISTTHETYLAQLKYEARKRNLNP